MFFKKDELTADEAMMKYMKEKYQEEFTAGLCSTANWAYNYDSMTVYSDKFPGEFIQVYRYGKRDFQDNYLAYLFREDVEQLVHKIVEPLFGECKVFLSISNFPVKGNLSKDASLRDYLKNKSAMDRIFIYFKEFNPNNNYTERLETLSEQFKEGLLPRSIRLFFLKPDKSLAAITREIQYEIKRLRNEKSWFVKKVSINLTVDYELKEKEKDKNKL